MSENKPTFSFSKKFRLSRRDGFGTPLKQRPLMRTWFAIYVDPNSLGHPRLGIAISKRLTPLACNRNRVKRLVRESFRQFTTTTASKDVVVRLCKPLLPEAFDRARSQLNSTLKEVMGIK